MTVATEQKPYQIWLTETAEKLSPADINDDPVARCVHLEQGGIIYYDQSPFRLSKNDLNFLLSQKQLENAYHKNIAYKPALNKLSGIQANNGTDIERLKAIMHHYAEETSQWLQTVLSPYQNAWRYDYTSFRPVEEQGRKLRVRAQNDRLHVDSFPTRATNGARILRVFVNIHPTRVRTWQTGEPFERLSRRFKPDMWRYTPQAKTLAQRLGMPWAQRPAYDRWMMDFHNFLKENELYQQTANKNTWEFPPGSAWAVYTDTVSHAVLAGQYAMEQTFMIEPHGMVKPEAAPINLLEQLYA